MRTKLTIQCSPKGDFIWEVIVSYFICLVWTLWQVGISSRFFLLFFFGRLPLTDGPSTSTWATSMSMFSFAIITVYFCFVWQLWIGTGFLICPYRNLVRLTTIHKCKLFLVSLRKTQLIPKLRGTLLTLCATLVFFSLIDLYSLVFTGIKHDGFIIERL